MRNITIIFVLNLVLLCFALPVTQKKEPPKHESNDGEANQHAALEYERYLREIVEALESDPEFRKKLDTASEADIRSGKIAQELDYVGHHVRSKLDEIKRREIDRLRSLANKQYELSNDIDRDHLKINEHLDHGNEHTFEIDDLRKLIHKTSQDLAAADLQRREEFKEYELQKEFEKQEKLRQLDEQKRKEYEEQLKMQHEKHNKHEKLHHPGSKAQLEEVWEKQDHMEGQDFDPKSFFMMHDLDGNGVWDEVELKALFIKELDKIYQSGAPEDDIRERAEEMERMREHVFRESDTNRDGLISYAEFIEQTKRDDFNRDPNWETVDNQPQFTHEEYLEFERKRKEEIERLIATGQLPPHPNMPQGRYPHPNQAEPTYHQQQQQNYNPQQQDLHHQQQQKVYNQQQYQGQQHQYQGQQQQYQGQQQQYQGQQQYQQPQQPYQQPPPQYQPPPPQHAQPSQMNQQAPQGQVQKSQPQVSQQNAHQQEVPQQQAAAPVQVEQLNPNPAYQVNDSANSRNLNTQQQMPNANAIPVVQDNVNSKH